MQAADVHTSRLNSKRIAGRTTPNQKLGSFVGKHNATVCRLSLFVDHHALSHTVHTSNTNDVTLSGQLYAKLFQVSLLLDVPSVSTAAVLQCGS